MACWRVLLCGRVARLRNERAVCSAPYTCVEANLPTMRYGAVRGLLSRYVVLLRLASRSMTEYINPAVPGLPQQACASCDLRVVAITLRLDQCVQCAKDKRADDTGQMRLR